MTGLRMFFKIVLNYFYEQNSICEFKYEKWFFPTHVSWGYYIIIYNTQVFKKFLHYFQLLSKLYGKKHVFKSISQKKKKIIFHQKFVKCISELENCFFCFRKHKIVIKNNFQTRSQVNQTLEKHFS